MDNLYNCQLIIVLAGRYRWYKNKGNINCGLITNHLSPTNRLQKLCIADEGEKKIVEKIM